MASQRARFIRSGTSRGAHVRALAALLLEAAERLEADGPHWRAVVIKDHLMALIRAYPELQLSSSDVAQMVAEEDGETIPE